MDDFPSIDLSVLTARQREVIEMRYSSCLSWREIGGFLGISHVTVIGHHHKAIKRLRDSMEATIKHLLVGGSCAEPLKTSASRPG